MLIDVGGYTVDITLNEIIDKKRNLKQLSPPSGGPIGSMNINKDLIDLIYEIYGKEKIENIINNDYQSWKLTLDSIEKKKKEVEYHGSDTDEFRINYVMTNVLLILHMGKYIMINHMYISQVQ